MIDWVEQFSDIISNYLQQSSEEQLPIEIWILIFVLTISSKVDRITGLRKFKDFLRLRTLPRSLCGETTRLVKLNMLHTSSKWPLLRKSITSSGSWNDRLGNTPIISRHQNTLFHVITSYYFSCSYRRILQREATEEISSRCLSHLLLFSYARDGDWFQFRTVWLFQGS